MELVELGSAPRRCQDIYGENYCIVLTRCSAMGGRERTSSGNWVLLGQNDRMFYACLPYPERERTRPHSALDLPAAAFVAARRMGNSTTHN